MMLIAAILALLFPTALMILGAVLDPARSPEDDNALNRRPHAQFARAVEQVRPPIPR